MLNQEEILYLNWEDTALYCKHTFGSFVDLENKFFICPECNEPIFLEDWRFEYPQYICPICETNYNDEEY